MKNFAVFIVKLVGPLIAVLAIVTGCPVSDVKSVPTRGIGVGYGYVITLSSGIPENIPNPAEEYKNFYGICWRGTNADNLRFAKNMGYRYIFYRYGMEEELTATEINFYVQNPSYTAYPDLFNDWRIRTLHTYTTAERENIEGYFAWKSTAPFPDNIATGWFFSETEFRPQPDFQQQRVVDYFVDAEVQYVLSRERPENGFLAAGVAWDVPQLTGDFHRGTLLYWTGADSSVLHGDITHEYATYSDGTAAYYKALMQRLRQELPSRQMRFIMEPYLMYGDWIRQIENRADRLVLMPDLLFQEDSSVFFVEDNRIFDSGLITRDRVGCTTPDVHDEPTNRLIAAKAAVNGSWFNWYGRFGGTGDKVDFDNIYEVPAWLQLIRVVANWDNLSGVPLDQRSWDGTIYRSQNSLMDGHVIATRNPYTGKLFVVFLDETGQINLNDGETVVSIARTDAYFGETEDGSEDFSVNGTLVRLNN